jgi:hypothetical protein
MMCLEIKPYFWNQIFITLVAGALKSFGEVWWCASAGQEEDSIINYTDSGLLSTHPSQFWAWCAIGESNWVFFFPQAVTDYWLPH